VAALTVAGLASGCGSGAPLPPAAEPADAPPAAREPAGRVVDLGARVSAVAVDERTGRVTVWDGCRAVELDGASLDVLDRLAPDCARAPGWTSLDDGTPVRVDATRRRLRVGDEEVPAGLGPTAVAAGDDGRVYVTDTDGGSVLYFRTRPHLGLVRRAGLAGTPYATAIDREKGKLWVTLTATNEVAQLTADGAPRVQQRFPTVRQPNAIAVDGRRGRVYVAGPAGEIQAFDGYPRS
jgi:hypothetical protein